MLINSCTPLSFVLVLVLFWPSSGQTETYIDVNNNDAVTNERPPLTGDDLAKYWGLDCPQIAFKTDRWIQKGRLDHPLDLSSIDWRGLELCAVIYNVPNTGRYEPCPDYAQARQVLRSLSSVDKESSISTDDAKYLVINRYLINCKSKNKLQPQ